MHALLTSTSTHVTVYIQRLPEKLTWDHKRLTAHLLLEIFPKMVFYLYFSEHVYIGVDFVGAGTAIATHVI